MILQIHYNFMIPKSIKIKHNVKFAIKTLKILYIKICILQDFIYISWNQIKLQKKTASEFKIFVNLWTVKKSQFSIHWKMKMLKKKKNKKNILSMHFININNAWFLQIDIFRIICKISILFKTFVRVLWLIKYRIN